MTMWVVLRFILLNLFYHTPFLHPNSRDSSKKMANKPTTSSIRGQFDAASRQNFSLFLRRVMTTVSPGVRYVHNWHIDAIAEYLAACASGQVTRLIINLPPRMLKSTIISVAWPAWLLGHNPARRIMVASYAQSLSLKHSTDCRAVMEAQWYRRLFPHTQLSHDQNEKEKFATTARGYRRAVSVGGAAIGEGGDVLIVDDPINPLQAGHRQQREGVNEWFDHTWATRLDDKRAGAMLLLMQRLHVDDLSGYLLSKGGWEHLCLPAIAPHISVINVGGFTHVREAGDALHKNREPLAVLERLKLDVGSANFSAQYQQKPLKLVGSIVKPEWMVRFGYDDEDANHRNAEVAFRFHRRGGVLDECGDNLQIIQSWDTGIKSGTQHDASACTTFALRNGVHHLVDMLVVRQEYPQLKRLIISHAARFLPEAVLIEDKGSGQSLLQDLRRETDLPLIAINPTSDKLTRLMRVTPLMEAGKMALPIHAGWLAAFEAEFFSFPDGAHDDQVDAVSQYLNWVVKRSGNGQMRVRRV